MTSAAALRRAVIASFVLGAMLAALTPLRSAAEGPVLAPREILSLDATDGLGQRDGSAPAVTPTYDPATSGDNTLIENAWDFTDPDSIPGFASVPYRVLPNPEIVD